MKANKVSMLVALAVGAKAGSNDSALVNFLSQNTWYNLEADNSHPIITEGDGDINV